MKIYHLQRTDAISWDEYAAFVVVAPSEGVARLLASQEAADEGPETWLDASKVTAAEIGFAFAAADGTTTPRIIEGSFNAG